MDNMWLQAGLWTAAAGLLVMFLGRRRTRRAKQ